MTTNVAISPQKDKSGPLPAKFNEDGFMQVMRTKFNLTTTVSNITKGGIK